jgi:hypothetical protein
MSDWRAILERAATLSRYAAEHLPALIRLLEAVIEKRASVDEVHAELGTIVDRRPGFIEALDAALRAGRRDQPGFTAARAVLFELPDILDTIVSVPPLGPAPDTELGAVATLARMVAREHATPEVARHSTFACSRCGSRRIETRHTDAFERREIEARCADCGNYGAWTEGDAEEVAWRPGARVAAVSPTQLTDTFVEYLQSGAADPRALAAVLRSAGFSLEGAFLERAGSHGGWDDWPRVFVGRRPPDDATAGDVWVDSVEVMPMVLVEAPTFRRDPAVRLTWHAIRPVMRWQFRAFAAVASIVERTVQVALPVTPLDPARLAGDELLPITSITAGEAALYARWFGKVPGARNAWRGAAKTLGAERTAALWTPGLHEWTNERCSADEGLRVRIGPDEVELSADDDYIAMRNERVELRTLVGEAAHEQMTGMRTSTSSLIDTVSTTGLDFESITISAVYPR